ncbi:MAG TPA: antibiotic biosynthesis monooxygenase [Chloroflexota bacterium]
MYARVAVYTFAPGGADIVIERAQTGMLPIYRRHAGFRRYIVAKTGENAGISISIWETEAQANEAVQAAAQWVKDNVANLITSVTNHVGNVAFNEGPAS